MAADAQAGSASGGTDHLEHVIANQCEKLLSDRQTATTDKLNCFAPDFEAWVSSEPDLALADHMKLLEVTRHSSFERIKAKIMSSCCSGKTSGSQNGLAGVVTQPNPQCSLHSPEVQLHDLAFEITQAVHPVFSDNVHVLQDRSEAGWVGVRALVYEVCLVEYLSN